MSESVTSTSPHLPEEIPAYGVHLFTATGSLCGLLAIDAVYRADFRASVLWMMVACAIDGADGTLARRARVKEVLPNLDWSLMDNMIDYLNFVIVPALLLWKAPVLPAGLEFVGAALICLSSSFQFSQTDAKTDDHYFKGFPSYWNILAFYLLIGHLDPWVNLGIIALCAALVFVPIKYIYPSRTVPLMRTTLALTMAWSGVMILLWLQYPRCDPWLIRASLVYVAYYVGVSLLLTLAGRGSEASASQDASAP